jgi:hypothetical protein
MGACPVPELRSSEWYRGETGNLYVEQDQIGPDLERLGSTVIYRYRDG